MMQSVRSLYAELRCHHAAVVYKSGTLMMLQHVGNRLKLDLGGSILLRLVLNMATF